MFMVNELPGTYQLLCKTKRNLHRVTLVTLPVTTSYSVFIIVSDLPVVKVKVIQCEPSHLTFSDLSFKTTNLISGRQ